MLLPLILLMAAVKLEVPLGLDAFLPTPAANPLTVEKIQLGRRLFFEKRLSKDSTISCSTCHDPALAFTDARPKAVGILNRRGEFRSPRILNRVYGRLFFWDGRTKTLEEQVTMPIENPLEMDLPLPAAVARLANDYSGLTVESMRLALASYVRTILAGDSPYDRYLAGNPDALSDSAKLGLKVFRGKGGCISCHVGPNLSDEALHNTGIGKGAFKTPSLREVARQGPYMHNGSLDALEDVIEYYGKGGNKGPELDPELRELNLSVPEKAGLIDFLRALSGVIREGL